MMYIEMFNKERICPVYILINFSQKVELYQEDRETESLNDKLNTLYLEIPKERADDFKDDIIRRFKFSFFSNQVMARKFNDFLIIDLIIIDIVNQVELITDNESIEQFINSIKEIYLENLISKNIFDKNLKLMEQPRVNDDMILITFNNHNTFHSKNYEDFVEFLEKYSIEYKEFMTTEFEYNHGASNGGTEFVLAIVAVAFSFIKMAYKDYVSKYGYYNPLTGKSADDIIDIAKKHIEKQYGHKYEKLELDLFDTDINFKHKVILKSDEEKNNKYYIIVNDLGKIEKVSRIV